MVVVASRSATATVLVDLRMGDLLNGESIPVVAVAVERIESPRRGVRSASSCVGPLMRRVLITGAAGNLGGKLRHHLTGCELVLLDRVSGGDPAIAEADLSAWGAWADRF